MMGCATMPRRLLPSLLALSSTLLPSHFVVSSIVPALEKVGNNGEPVEVFPLAKCLGDCDSDDECDGDLVCYKTNVENEVIPGCAGVVSSIRVDYCFERSSTFLWRVGNNGVPAEVFPLKACEGDCDRDSDCDEGLTCMQRSSGEHVWGCEREDYASSTDDFCFDPNLMPTASPTTSPPSLSPTLRPSRNPAVPTLEVARPLEYMGNNGDPPYAFPLDACQADCDNDSDCQDGLLCYQAKELGETVPGCTGVVTNVYHDVCFLKPPTFLWDYGGTPPAAVIPLQACEGDCDGDGDCSDGLVCLQRSDGEVVPGCYGEERMSASRDFCVDPALTPKPTGSPTASPTTAEPSAGPTPRPTRAPAVPTLEVARPLEYMGNNGDPSYAFPLDACLGDCDYDSDCQDGLVCYKTKVVGETIPGCTGVVADLSIDYCFHRPPNFLRNMGNNGLPEEAFPLVACEGDCDRDSECAEGLTCMQRSSGEHVWGCIGENYASSTDDICFDPNLMPTASPTTADPSTSPTLRPTRAPAVPTLEVARPLEYMGNNGDPSYAFPLDACQGDCDTDSDCQDDLACYKTKVVGETIPGCTGVVADLSIDYCFHRPPNFLWNMGNNGLPEEAFPLVACEGDCDRDSECAEGLTCMQRSSGERVWGCIGENYASSTDDICFDPNLMPTASPTTADPSTSPTLRPTRAPAVPTLEVARPLELVGNNGEPAHFFPLDACLGDCDIDSDCQDGLLCFQSDNVNDAIPGCDGITNADDYCFERPPDYLYVLGNNGEPASAFPLPLCAGDCDDDEECAGDLKCFKFNSPEPVPGCVGEREGSNDYCWARPPKYLWTMGNNGAPESAYPLNECEGDCDNDSECAEGLSCFHRTHGEAVYGCVGLAADDTTDYCQGPTPEPTMSPITSSPTDSPTTAEPTSAPTLNTVNNILVKGSVMTAFGCNNPDPKLWPRALDGSTEKHLCDRTGLQGIEDAGLVVMPWHNKLSVAQALRVYSQNDCSGCDPASYVLEGRSDPSEAWTVIGEGYLPWVDDATTGRNARGLDVSSTYDSPDASLVHTEVALSNALEYVQYKLTFPSTRDEASNSLQFAEVELAGVLYEDSSLPLESPDPFVQAIVCPAAAEPFKTIPSGYKVAKNAPTGMFCGIFIQKADGAIIPYTRSYDGHDWEASPGPYAMSPSDVTCFVDCEFTLPALEDSDDSYVIFSKDGATHDAGAARRLTAADVRMEIARFLEMTTFGPKKAEIEALDDGSWGAAARAQYIRQQMDVDMTSHREYYRARTNTNWEATTHQARSDHPCSPNSKWRRYAYIREDRFLTVTGSSKVTVFETVPEETHLTTTIYEADEAGDVAYGSGEFHDSSQSNRKGFSGVGYYDFDGTGDFLEFTIDVAEAGSYPLSFRYMNGSRLYGGNRACRLLVNNVTISAAYDFIYTGGWNYYRYSALVYVSLNAGQNTVKLLLDGQEQVGGPDIDHLRVGKPPAMVMKTNGFPRAIAKNGVDLLNEWEMLADGTTVTFYDEPRPPSGDLFAYNQGRIEVHLSEDRDRFLADGNLPVDFTGYEQYLSELPHGYITFDGTEIWDETASDLNKALSRKDQEVLLRNGLNHPICDLVPEFASESDAPLFGKLPDGTWLAWTPKVQLETNGPSINDVPGDMTSNVLSDGGGEWSVKTGEKLKCSNVARSFSNEGTCFLSTENTTCPSAEVNSADASAGVVVCGSVGEIANDPSMHETFAIETEEAGSVFRDVIANHKNTVWTEIALFQPDQLRQRMAWAIAQIVTTVPENIDADDQAELYVNFYDMLVRNAFGNYRDILLEASFSPLMGEHLTYRGSKSHAYEYHDKDKRVSRADENYAREIMQLFTIGLVVLNDDGTPTLDPVTGSQLEAYTNDHIQSFARAWTGLDRAKSRGNIEQDNSSSNRIDPMKIVPKWRDPFPKADLDDGFIGDRYMLCADLPAKSFLKEGAQYKLLGGSPLPELMEDPSEFANMEYSVLRAELSSSSALYDKLHNEGSYQLNVVLDADLDCFGVECQVETLRVVKVGMVYYEFVERPCVQLGFYNNGKQIMLRQNSRAGTMCANPDLFAAREACCREDRYKEVRNAWMETGVTYFYEGERMTYHTAKDRCVNYGRDLCLYENVMVRPSDDKWRKGYHWTNKDCRIYVKVNKEGDVAIVHDVSSTYVDNIPYHVEEENTLNWFRVFWNEGIYPGSSETNSCAVHGCKTMESDGSCLCKTTVTDRVVFTDLPSVSKEAVMSQLFVGTLGPQDGSTETTSIDGVSVHMVGGVIDINTVFEIDDKGRKFYLKNMLSTVGLEGWTMPPQIYEAEDATLSFSTIKQSSSSTGGFYVEPGTNSSAYIEWDVEVPSAGLYLVSFRYALDKGPTRLDIEVNGDAIMQQPVNQEATIVSYGSSPPAEKFPLQRCEGDCDDDDHCENGLVCMQNDNLESVPGCTDNIYSAYDYCVDASDFTNVGFLPTGGWTGDWHYSTPLEVNLISGLNTIRAKIPNEEHVIGPNLDHVRIEGLSTPSTVSFRNPPHFMSLIREYDASSISEIGEATIRDAQYETNAVIDHYFYQDNVAPFLCTRIMQRFGFSNPSPRYVANCANAFRSGSYSSGSVSFGSGKYGSLEAVAAAIFLDIEATDSAVAKDPSFGSMKEPILTVTNMLRSMEYQTHIPALAHGPQLQSTYPVETWEITEKIGQGPYDFPSVFSFFLPEYVPSSGPNLPARLVSPETMVSTAPNVVNLLNGLLSLIKYGLSDCGGGFAKWPGYGSCEDNGLFERSIGHLFYEPTGTTLDEKIDDLALLLTAGRLSNVNRDTIVAACSSETDQESQVRCMQQLIISTGEFQTTNVVTQNGEDRASAEIPVGESSEPYKAIIYYYLGGGLDSYNLLAPHTCTNDLYEKYRTARGKSSNSEGVGLPLSRQLEVSSNNPLQPCSSFGIHENMPVLQELYNEGKLNFIANAGLVSKPLNVNTYKDETWRSMLFSHNMMNLETKREDLFDEFGGTGVGGRLADVLTQKGISTNQFSVDGQSVFLTGVAGQSPSQYILNSRGLDAFNEAPSIENMESVMRSLNSATTAESGFHAETWSSKLVDLFDKQALLEAELTNTSATTTFPDMSSTADEFKLITKIMQTAEARGSKRDIFYVDTGGFDTHSDVDTRLIDRFTSINDAFVAFVAELKALHLWEQTVLVQFSEFGRTLNPNSGGGTDHGWGGHHFMFGGAVDGGKVLGQYPDNFERDDEAEIMLSRGRSIPTTPWDAMWLGVAEWFGATPNSLEMDKVLPLHKNFPTDKLYGKDDLFIELGLNEGGSMS